MSIFITFRPSSQYVIYCQSNFIFTTISSFEERTTQRQTDNKDTGLKIQIIASPQKNKNKEQLIKDQIFEISLELIQRVVEEV